RTIGSGELYRLGRLEFVLRAWDYPFRVYANSQTHEVIVLAEAEQRFTSDGYLVGSTTWTSTLTESDDAVIGIPISPRGHALPQSVRLPRSAWRMVLSQDDPVRDMHVPGEGALTLNSLLIAHQRQVGKCINDCSETSCPTARCISFGNKHIRD